MSSSEFSQYLTDIGRFPVLSRESQLRHCQAIHRWVHWEGGRECAPKGVQRVGARSLDTMVKTNLRLVVSIAKKYQSKGVALEDLIQEGNIGLIRGLELFDPSRGYQVSTYCYWWVRQGVTRAIHSYARTIRMPINSHELLVKIRRHRQTTLSETGKYPTIEDTAQFMDLTVTRVKELLNSWEMTNCSSLDAQAGSSDDPGSNIVDLIPNPTPTTENDPTEYLLSASGDLRLRAAIHGLTDTEQLILEGIYENDRSQKHISEELNVSRTRVGQVHSRAIKKLRLAMKA